MKTALTLLAVLTATLTAVGQGVLLSDGQSLDYSFSSLTPTGPSDGLYVASFSWVPGGFPGGSTVVLSLFEASSTDTPFRTGEFQGYTPLPGEIVTTSAGFIAAPGVHSPAWQNQQGLVRLSVTSGSILLNSLEIATVIDGIRYQGSAPVPEPSASTLMISCLVVLALARYRRAQPGGAANRSQPIRSETNRTSAAAGSGR